MAATPADFSPLSPLDGRYRTETAPLAAHLSEAGLNRARVRVEVEWLIALTDRRLFGTDPLPLAARDGLRALVTDFGSADVAELATLEAETRHDVKAIEYYLRRRLISLGLDRYAELVHFACTSEDINNVAYALTIRQAVVSVWLPRVAAVEQMLQALATQHRDLPMLSRTHGQPATPTTLGKEIAVFAFRLRQAVDAVRATTYWGKLSGATGTYSAHIVAAPEADWPGIAQDVLASLDLRWNPLTTQIEPHDWQAALYQRVAHTNRVLHNFATDVWTYISLGYFRQIPVPGATGSSTMPHKVNPIRFENAEANLELSCALLDALAATLVTSRLQRDLTDSTTQRNIGVAFGYSLLAATNLCRGLAEIAVAPEVLAADLDANWEVLAEAVQTVIRAEVTAGRSQIRDPYALLKDLTRGRRLDHEALAGFIRDLDIGADAKARLLALTPATYTGLAASLVTHLPPEA